MWPRHRVWPATVCFLDSNYLLDAHLLEGRYHVPRTLLVRIAMNKVRTHQRHKLSKRQMTLAFAEPFQGRDPDGGGAVVEVWVPSLL